MCLCESVGIGVGTGACVCGGGGWIVCVCVCLLCVCLCVCMCACACDLASDRLTLHQIIGGWDNDKTSYGSVLQSHIPLASKPLTDGLAGLDTDRDRGGRADETVGGNGHNFGCD